MDNIKSPFRGIISDFQGRKACYKQDWEGGLRSGLRILAPTMYIFFASALPVIAFGEQLSWDTDGALSTVEALASTAIYGIIHSIIGGQPLLILGVAGPTGIMYSYLYNFTINREGLGQNLFLAWAGLILAAVYLNYLYSLAGFCIWTALLLFLLVIFNACTIITRFTRIAGEIFGMLINVLLIQEAIKGVISEFNVPHGGDKQAEKYQFHWLYTNGLLGIIFSFGARILGSTTIPWFLSVHLPVLIPSQVKMRSILFR
ncbi:Boron transporter 4 [Ranunculus cassubicifolius]